MTETQRNPYGSFMSTWLSVQIVFLTLKFTHAVQWSWLFVIWPVFVIIGGVVLTNLLVNVAAKRMMRP